MQIPLLSNDDKYLTNDEKLRLFQRILFYLVVGGASADGKTNALKPLWITADIQSLAERTEIRPTFGQKNEILHSFTSRSGLRLSYGSVFVHNKGWKKVDFSEFTTNTGKDANSLQSEHQLAYFFKMNPTLMNPTLTPQEEENIKRCDLLYFPFPLNQEVNARRISPQVRLTEAIELNRENIYAKPMEDENRYVDENLDEILEKAKRSGQPQPIRKRWSDLEKFLKVGQTTTAGKDMARNEVDWETMRRECTSLACTWTLYSRGSQSIYLYEKSKAIWSRAGTTGPDITNRLKALYPKNRTDEEEKMALDSD